MLSFRVFACTELRSVYPEPRSVNTRPRANSLRSVGPSPTGCLSGKVCYTPQGTFYALSIGQSSGFTGLNLTHIYNSRLQPQEFKASSTGANAIDITYNFVDPSTNKNAGIIYGITNNLDSTRSQTFAYDQLNRITSALTTSTYSTSSAHCWGETYSLDAWANLNSIAATTNPNYTGCSQESGFSRTADGNNHLSGFSYDASGNTSSDTVNSYTWNGESQLVSAAGVNYLYDGDGRRVAKVGSKLYWYGSGDDILAETDASGNTTAEYIFFGGKRIAMLPAGGNPTYYVEDMLGTSRVLTTNSGVVCYDADFYPYGGERSYTNTCPQNYKFESKERDTETGNDDFGARYYSNRFGRWLSADWSAVPEAVPYANLSNPQTLNLYAMVSDDPESFADLDGHCGELTPCQKDFNDFQNGMMKSIINMAISLANSSTKTFDFKVPDFPLLTPDNKTEKAGMVATDIAVTAISVADTALAIVDARNAATAAEAAVPDANVVVRGGESELPTSGTYSGAHGATLDEAASGVQHGQIRTSTAGDIRNAGGRVRSAPEPAYENGPINERHVNIRGGQRTFGPLRKNPVPKSQRVPSRPKTIGGEKAPTAPTVRGPNGLKHTGGPS